MQVKASIIFYRLLYYCKIIALVLGEKITKEGVTFLTLISLFVKMSLKKRERQLIVYYRI